MRSLTLGTLGALIALVALPVPAQSAEAAVAKPGPVTAPPRDGVHPPPRTGPCCVRKVWDARGLEVGEVIDYDERFPSQPLGAYVAYRIKGGDAVPLIVAPELISSIEDPGSSNALFTTPDCSGNSMFAMLYRPPLAKRYGMMLLSGYPHGPGSNHAWLWVTDPLPVRAFPPAGTIYHSQWNNDMCQPFPAPGYTINVASGVGGYPMHRVEDLLAKYQRPFFINY